MKDKQNILSEIISVSGLIFIFIILVCIFLGHQGNILIDSGKTPYMAQLVLSGKVLVKDIFLIYGPLSYQINAFLFNLLGTHLNTLYLAGILNSLLILISYYMIARKITSIKVAWLSCFLVMGICIFSHYHSNYIFPYSYSMTYALSALLFSVLFCLYYLEKSNSTYLIISSFFAGISAACKIDFILFMLPLLAIAVYFKRLTPKQLILFILAFISVPVLSWTMLFIQGLTFSEFFEYLGKMKAFVSSNAFEYIYSHYTGLYFNEFSISSLIMSAKGFFYNYSICLISFYIYFMFFKKIPKFKGKLFFQIITFIALYLLFPIHLLKELAQNQNLGWISVGTAAMLLLFLFIIYIKKGGKKPALKDNLFILITIAGLLTSFKSFFYLNINMFGAFLLPLLLLSMLVFIFDIMPEYLKFLDKKVWPNANFVIFLMIGIVFLFSNMYICTTKINESIQTTKGKIYTHQEFGDTFNKLISYVEKETTPEQTLLVMPEGILLNFLTNRKLPSYFWAFNPPITEIFEEDVLNDLKNQKPDCIIITNQYGGDYNLPYFGKDYAHKIYGYVKNHYNYIKTVKSNQKETNRYYLRANIYRKK